MTTLNRIILQRLKRLPKISSVWEVDRRQISDFVASKVENNSDSDAGHSDCILWVDGTQGTVRALSIVPSDSGYEPLVRAFLQAMENPQGPQSRGRPQRIVVSDREIQFYLRGVLHELDITVDYVPSLPLIDELFEALQQEHEPQLPELPERYATALMEKALDLWEVAPWHILNEQQILALCLNAWEIETLYVSVLGMAGVEYGLLLYRSLESLQQFRQRVLGPDQSAKQMQEAFLEQDCFYLNYELISSSEPTPPHLVLPGLDWLADSPEAINPEFGSLHPLEGMRTALVEEEGATLLVALEALDRFFQKHYSRLQASTFPALESRYRIPNPEPEAERKLISVTVKTLPAVAAALAEQTNEALAEQAKAEGLLPVLRDDFVPEGSLILLLLVSPEQIAALKAGPTVYWQSRQPAEELPPPPGSEGLPVVLIQTSRPKARTLIRDLQQAGGVRAICFNPGRDLIGSDRYELGMIQTGNREFHLFAEYRVSDPIDQRALERWQRWQKDYRSACAVVVAGGVTGVSKGRPLVKDMYAVFETTTQPPEALGLPPLQLQSVTEWEVD